MTFYNTINDASNFVISFSANPRQDFGIFAKGYSRAASTLAEQLLEKTRFSDYEAYPVVFLYRQAFELYLKAFYYKAALISAFRNIQSIDSNVHHHKLVPLAQTFKRVCQVIFPSDQLLLQVADKVNLLAVEFEQIDKDSFSYRYPTDKQGNASTQHHQITNLLAIHQAMKALLEDLEIIDFGMDIEANQAQKVYEILQEAQKLITSDSDEEN